MSRSGTAGNLLTVLLTRAKVSEKSKVQHRSIRTALDTMDLDADTEARLGKIFTIFERIEEDRQ